MRVGDLFSRMDGVELQVELDQVGLEVPLPPRVVRVDGIGFFRHHRERPRGGIAPQPAELGHEDFVEVIILVEPGFDVDPLKAIERHDFPRGRRCRTTSGQRNREQQDEAEKRSGPIHCTTAVRDTGLPQAPRICGPGYQSLLTLVCSRTSRNVVRQLTRAETP